MKGLLKIFFLFCILLPGLLRASSIDQIMIEGEMLSTNKEKILQLLPLREGEPFDPAKLDWSLQILRAWGIFDRLEKKIVPTPEGMQIHIDLHEAPIISDIRILKNFPFLTTKVKKRLNLQVGDIWNPEKIEEQKTRIKKFYQRRGFFEPDVLTSTETTESKNNIRLIFKIIKGYRLRYKEVEYEGVRAFSKARMYNYIKPLDIYSNRRLKQNLQEIVSFYRSRGYLKAKARMTKRKINWKTKRVSLKIVIDEGPKVNVLFRGPKPYRQSTLKKTITLFKEGSFDSIELALSADNLVKKLQRDGFKEARVTFKRHKISPEHYRIVFDISTGPRSFVYSIHFKGNDSIAASKLLKQMLTQKHSIFQKGVLDESQLAEDKKILAEFYQSFGFSDVFIEEPRVFQTNRWRTDIEIHIQEGPQVMVQKVDLPEQNILKALHNIPGVPLNRTVLAYDKEQVQFYHADHGYPYATVEQKVERAGNQVTITYNVDKGPLVTLGEILYVGDVLTSVRVLKKAIAIQKGDLYSRRQLIEAGLNLRRLGIFNTVNIEAIGLDEKKTMLPIKVKVEERDPFVMDIDAQYSTDTQLSGMVRFTNYNTFGWAKQTRLLFIGGQEKDRAELSWLDPRFMGSNVQMTVSNWLDYEKQPLETSLQAAGAVSFFRLYKRFGFLGRYQLARTYIISGQSTNQNALRDSTFSEITLSASYDTRDSFSDPTKGIFALTGVQLFNEIRGLQDNFAKLKAGFNNYLPFNERVTFSNTLRLDRIQDIGQMATIPQRELFVLGGDDTLRGFKEDRVGLLNAKGNPLGGRLRWIYNGELHFHFAHALQGALFFDTGALTNQFSEIDLSTVRHSAGFGLRYITPVGPIRADYGIILDRRSGENFGRFHLTFGYPL